MNKPATPSIHILGMVVQSIRFYRWSMFLIAIGAAATTAVIVGALLVGDSVRGSMKHLVTDRLGQIEHLIFANRFISEDSALRMGQAADFPKDLEPPIPAFLFPNGTAEWTHDRSTNRSGSILVLGCNERFWTLGEKLPVEQPQGNQVILNAALAEELQAKVDDEVTLRLPIEQAVPSDSPLGERDDLSRSLPKLKVIAIVPNEGLGRFDLRASQKPPRNAYVSLELIQKALDRPKEINAIFVGRKKGARSNRPTSAEIESESTVLLECMQPTLDDLGIRIEGVRSLFPRPKGENIDGSKVVFDYQQISSDQLLIPPSLVQAIQRKLPPSSSQPVLTYLANAIEKVESPRASDEPDPNPPTERLSVPYSTISAIDAGATFGFLGGGGVLSPDTWDSLKPGTVAVNSWLAQQLSLSVGDRVRVYYYLPETVHGKEIEESFESTVAVIVPITRPSTPFRRNREAIFDELPTLYNDPSLTPEVPGITDQDSIADWDVPFPLERKVRGEDDDYWNRYRLTPKLFLPLAEGQKRFGSRFGNVSSIRVQSSQKLGTLNESGALAETLLPALREEASSLGLKPIPIYHQQLESARGTTPFDMLFLSLSFFVIVAALILVSLLFRLGVEQRASQWGLLLSVGWRPTQVRNLLLFEGGAIAAIGGLLGLVIGIGYAYLMIWGLRGWWLGAIQTAFLDFHAGAWSLILGWLLGWVASLLTLFWSVTSLSRLPALRLLRDRIDESAARRKAGSNRSRFIILSLCVMAVLGLGAGFGLSGEARAGSFVGGGMLLLVAAILTFHRSLRTAPSNDKRAERSLSIASMASQSARRNPLRSTLSAGMIALATFLILSMSLFQAKPSLSGVGGFTYMAESSVPLARDLSDAKTRRAILGPQEDQLSEVSIISMRLRPGDDASCNNLYQSNQPRVLGIRPELAERDGALPIEKRFPWAAKDKARNEAEKSSPFAMLEREGEGTEQKPFPVILDLNTAMWSLHRGAAIGEIFSFEYDQKVIYFQTVGLLQNTLMQGFLMMSETHFMSAFPSISGYQSFLVDDSQVAKSVDVRSLLETGWGDEGLDATKSSSILESLLAVQNTYLSAFQVLGALGLLLGTFGLAVIQTRSVIERRGELALLQAVGYPRSRLGLLLMSENARLLLVGIVMGVGAAFIAAVPAWLGGQPISSFQGPIGMVMLVVVTGLASGIFAVYRAHRLPLLESLRGK